MRYWDIVSRASEIMESSSPDIAERMETLHRSMGEMIKEMHGIDQQLSKVGGKLETDVSMGDVMEPVYSAQDALAKFINKVKRSNGGRSGEE